jgi:hypothetical protein
MKHVGNAYGRVSVARFIKEPTTESGTTIPTR